jgi:hypothetical protein
MDILKICNCGTEDKIKIQVGCRLWCVCYSSLRCAKNCSWMKIQIQLIKQAN